MFFLEFRKDLIKKIVFCIISVGVSVFFILCSYVFLNLFKISTPFFKNYFFLDKEKQKGIYVFVDKVDFCEEDFIEISKMMGKKDIYLVYGTEVFVSGNSYKIFFADERFFKKEFGVYYFSKWDYLISKRLKNNNFFRHFERFLKEYNLLKLSKEFDNLLYANAIFLNEEIKNNFLLTTRPQFLKIELDNFYEIKEARKNISNYFINKYKKEVFIYSPYEHLNKLVLNFTRLIAFLLVLGVFYFIFLYLFMFKFISDLLKIFIKKYFCYRLIGYSKIHVFVLLFSIYFLIFICSFVFSTYILKSISLNIYTIFLSFLISFIFLTFLFIFIYKREYVNNKIFS